MPAPILVVSGLSGAGKTTLCERLAKEFSPSAHVRIDDFVRFIASGLVDPSGPEAGAQNWVLGGSVASAAMRFAEGGYTTLVDGYLFPDGIEGMATMCARADVPLHYAVLRPDIDTCQARVAARPGIDVAREDLRRAHERFSHLGRFEPNAFAAMDAPGDVADEVLTAFRGGRLAV